MREEDTLKEIGAREIKEILKNGIEHLSQDRTLLNEINVYPVADGDTGDNLVNTFRPIYEVIDHIKEERIDRFMSAFSSQVLASAQGNSGVIFSQFFFSFAKAIKGKNTLNTQEFADAMEAAIGETYRSVQSPKEGTILTVIRHTAEELKKVAGEEELFDSAFDRVIHKTKEILEKTKDMLPQLKKAKVVDSGGLGFYLFFKGMTKSFKNKTSQWLEISRQYLRQMKHYIAPTPDYKYCCQWTIRPRGHDKLHFKKLLKTHGGSLVLSGDEELLTVHIHSDTPDVIEGLLTAGGDILSRKIDNLHRQQADMAKKEVAIVIDSGVDLPDGMESEVDILVVPISLSIDGQLYRDRVDISKEEFFATLKRLRNPILKTSQPSPAAFKECYEKALRSARRVLVFTITSVLSGTHASAQSAIKLLEDADDRERIHVIDTLNLSGGAGLLTLTALRLLAAKESWATLLAKLEEMKTRIASLVYLKNLDYVVRGGRAPRLAGFLTRLLGWRPLLTVAEGRLQKAGILFSSSHKEKKVARKFLAGLDANQSYTVQIVYTDNPASADKLEAQVRRSALRISSLLRERVTAVLGVHAGPGAFGLFAIPDIA